MHERSVTLLTGETRQVNTTVRKPNILTKEETILIFFTNEKEMNSLISETLVRLLGEQIGQNL